MWFLYSIILFLFIFNIALSLKIPFILPVFGMFILGIIPGYLVCLLFRIRVTDCYENFLYLIGVSILFDLIFGLLINTLLPVFGIDNPLSYQNLQMLYSIIILILTLLIVYTDNTPSISFKIPELGKQEKIFLISGFLLLICILSGIYLINADISNVLLLSSILSIPLFLMVLIVFDSEDIRRIYPFIIYLISFSLLMLLSLRSNYILGIDTHEEYYFFSTTLINSRWIPDTSSLLTSALSISILPVIFENFLNINPQLLFKIFYPCLFSITPLIIFVIGKKLLQ